MASISDGAGSASQAEYGARLAVDSFQTTFLEAASAEPDLTFLGLDRAQRWLAELQSSIQNLAAESGFAPSDYACTFLGAVISEISAVFIQIGDGAIVVTEATGENDALGWVFWPQHGEFANSTFFVTMDNAQEFLGYERRDQAKGPPIHEVAMFSDGLERLILDMAARTVHSPSLRPILGWLAGTDPSSTVEESDVLRTYLNSANVNRRTDDDKTLIVATKVQPVQAETSS